MANPPTVAEARAAHYGPPLAGTYPIEALDEEAYWTRFEETLRPHYPPEVFFSLRRDREPGMDTPTLSDHWQVMDGATTIAMFCGESHGRGRYQMVHTAVHPDHRRRGLYTDIIARALAYAEALGFSVVGSEHSPTNNAVLIAKLRAGFVITGVEVDAAFGISVALSHFLDPAELAAYRYRCGDAALTPELIAEGFGAMPQLREQFRASG